MAEEIDAEQKFHPGWDSQDTTGLDNELEEHDDSNDAETGAVLGVVSGAVIGALAGGPVGAVVGGVLGGLGAGAGVAAIERVHNQHFVDDGVRPSSLSPYPGEAGRPDVVQFNGTGITNAGTVVTEEDQEAVSDIALGGTLVTTPVQEDWHAVDNGSTVFHLHGYPDAEQVSVAGTFNEWSPSANPLRYLDGVWLTEIALAPGKHQYRFIVDGNWIADPHNPESVSDSSGNLNSIMIVERDVVIPPAAPLGNSNGAFEVKYR